MLSELRAFHGNMQYAEVIHGLKEFLGKDPRGFTHPFVKKWIKERYYDLFLQELEDDPRIHKEFRNNFYSKILRAIRGEDKVAFRKLMIEKMLIDTDRAPVERMAPDVKLPDLSHMTLVFAPGLCTTMIPVMAFRESFEFLEAKYNLRIVQADSHPLRSCESNMENLLDILTKGIGRNAAGKMIPEDQQRPVEGNFIFFGYSKGGPDIFTFLREYPEFGRRTRAIVTFSGANQGTPLADGVYELLKKLAFISNDDVESLFIKLLAPIIPVKVLKKIENRDLPGAVESLTTARNVDFWKKNGEFLDAMNIPVFTISAAVTMREVPYFQMQSKWALDNFDDRNDMEVLYEHSLVPIPMCVPTALIHTHHWDIAYEEFPIYTKLLSTRLRHRFPKVQMSVAAIKLLFELGLLE